MNKQLTGQELYSLRPWCSSWGDIKDLTGRNSIEWLRTLLSVSMINPRSRRCSKAWNLYKISKNHLKIGRWRQKNSRVICIYLLLNRHYVYNYQMSYKHPLWPCILFTNVDKLEFIDFNFHVSIDSGWE